MKCKKQQIVTWLPTVMDMVIWLCAVFRQSMRPISRLEIANVLRQRERHVMNFQCTIDLAHAEKTFCMLKLIIVNSMARNVGF